VPWFRPFQAWANGTGQLPWYADYNAIKHDREAEFRRATLKSLVNAMGAVYVLVVAQFGQFGHHTWGGRSDPRSDFAIQYPKAPAKEQYIAPHVGGQGVNWHPIPYF
jgi:hypothetical protein